MVNSIAKLQLLETNELMLMAPEFRTSSVDNAFDIIRDLRSGRSLSTFLLNGLHALGACLFWRPDVVFVHNRLFIPFLIIPRFVAGFRIIYCSHLSDVSNSLIVRFLTRGVDVVVTGTFSDMQKLKSRFPSWQAKICCIPMPLWAKEVRVRQSPKATEVHYLLAGRLEPIKGHETALKALAEVRHDWKLTIPGDVTNENIDYVNRLRQLCDSLHIADKVFFIGHTDFWKVNVDIALLPSSNDGLTLSALIFFLRRIPVVRSKTQGFFALEDGQLGFNIGDNKELSRLLDNIETTGLDEAILDKAEHYGRMSTDIDGIKGKYLKLCLRE